MKLSVVIPCYNEQSTIETVVEAVRAAPVEDVEIIVVDDGSTDGTRELLKAKPHGWVDKLVLQERNFGKGAALRAGFQAATGDIVIVQDADLEYDPQRIPHPSCTDSGGSCRRCVRLPVPGRPASSRGLLLAYGGKPLSHVAVQHVYKLEPH